MNELLEEIRRILREFLIFLVKLALAAAILLVDLGIKSLAAFVLDSDGYSFRILALILDVVFVGTAAVVSVTGAIVILAEFVVSTYRHLKRLKNETK